MSFVFPKVYMIQPLLDWADELKESESLSSDQVTNFKASAIAHGLYQDELVKAQLSLLYGKLAETELSGSVSNLAIQNEDSLEWSDNEDAVTNELETNDVADHLEHVNGSSTTVKYAQINTRRSGRMRK
tara:strand:+ start:120 stop:506 length:387 start_codon:yes stop_codon:yes gene_type:complete